MDTLQKHLGDAILRSINFSGRNTCNIMYYFWRFSLKQDFAPLTLKIMPGTPLNIWPQLYECNCFHTGTCSRTSWARNEDHLGSHCREEPWHPVGSSWQWSLWWSSARKPTTECPWGVSAIWTWSQQSQSTATLVCVRQLPRNADPRGAPLLWEGSRVLHNRITSNFNIINSIMGINATMT